MHVRDILSVKGDRVITIKPDATVAATSQMLAKHRIGAVLVTNADDAIIGIISERDIVRGLAQHGGAVAELAVADLMTREVRTCTMSDTIADIMGVMTAHRFRHLPVVEDGRLIGIVSIGDVVKYRLDETKLEVESLRDYVLAGR
ncbi:MAG: CBS domain-containing protein [Dongiaceae bacterium]